jgi:sugar porter (SP) family MFS transporter
MTTASSRKPLAHFVLFISGLGGLLYGIDIGVIDPALRYLNRSISLSESALSAVVAAVLAGSILGSVVAGMLADWLGRKRMMIGSGLIFVASVAIIYTSQSFVPLLVGRLLQGASGGLIAVVVPLYLAECLAPEVRGRGAAVFQFMLTIGIVLASLVGNYYTGAAESSIAAAGADTAKVVAAADHAWRGMFLSVAYPGMLFLAGALFLPESPRWLVSRGRVEHARLTLQRIRGDGQSEAELTDIRRSLVEDLAKRSASKLEALREIVTTRRYMLPFLLSCLILGCCQATGINSILQYMTTILQRAGLDPVTSSVYGSSIKLINSVMTVAAIFLVERKGRVFLLTLGTSGIAVALLLLSLVFFQFESHQVDVRQEIAGAVSNDSLELDMEKAGLARLTAEADSPLQLTILYNQGGKQALAEAYMAGSDAKHEGRHVIRIAAARAEGTPGNAKLEIVRANIGPIPSRQTGLLTALCIGLFIASFSIGPGVCVWLALSELMPTRIRSVGMGVALLINQGVSTLIALTFLPLAGRYGFHATFLFWALCTVFFLLTVRFFLPETKGKSLEEIEKSFA